MKRLTAILLLAMMAVMLCSCGGEAQQGRDVTPTAAVTETATTTSTPEKKEYSEPLLDEASGTFLVSTGTKPIPVSYEQGEVEETQTSDAKKQDYASMEFDYADGIPYSHVGVICDASMFRVEVDRTVEESSGDEVGGGTNKYDYKFYPKKAGTAEIIWLDKYFDSDGDVYEGSLGTYTIDENLKIKQDSYSSIATKKGFKLFDKDQKEIKPSE